MEIVFEPNPIKDARNLRDHGISFVTAQQVFDDPNQVVLENYFFDEDREQRYAAIGMTHGLLLLMVVFVNRSQQDKEIIRIISARKAINFEEKIYAAHLANQNH